MLACPKENEAWWKTVQPESPFGVLVEVEGGHKVSNDAPRITELLLIASRPQLHHGQRLPTPPASSPYENVGQTSAPDQQALQVLALAMSSDLLHIGNLPSPPLSPQSDDAEMIPAVFLPTHLPDPAETIHEPPTKKRRTATSTLDEAAARRASARRQGGEGISAAAAANPELSHRRTSSNTPLQTRPLSRSPSITSSRPGSVRGPAPLEKQPSTLSRVQTSSTLPTEPPSEASAAALTEKKNKDTISRVVMAGMRLYGLSQSTRKQHSKQQHSNSASPAPATPEPNLTPSELEAELRRDQEFTEVYNKAFKSVLFTFRAHVQTLALQGYTEALRDAADKFLALYCSDPLAQGLLGGEEKFTPGGRKAFGSAKMERQGESPFDARRGVA